MGRPVWLRERPSRQRTPYSPIRCTQLRLWTNCDPVASSKGVAFFDCWRVLQLRHKQRLQNQESHRLIGAGRKQNPFDHAKPWGLGQQAPLTPEYQAVFEASLADQAQ